MITKNNQQQNQGTSAKATGGLNLFTGAKPMRGYNTKMFNTSAARRNWSRIYRSLPNVTIVEM